MKDLIAALNIFLKYGNPYSPTHCEHDELWIYGYEDAEISDEDKVQLEKLGFRCDGNGWKSYRYGSA